MQRLCVCKMLPKILLQFAFRPDSVHIRVAFQVPPQVVQAGVGLGTDLAVVRSHP